MTRVTLRWNVFAVISGFAAVMGGAFIAKRLNQSFAYDFVKDFSSLIIAIGGAYLAYCFQRRQVFLAALRDLWGDMVSAKVDLVYYTNLSGVDEAAFREAEKSISRAIDLVRGVYRNVQETRFSKGYFPFEPLHDMRRSLRGLGWMSVTPERQKIARDEIIQGWNALRFVFLREFASPNAPCPIVERHAVDPRRSDGDDEGGVTSSLVPTL